MTDQPRPPLHDGKRLRRRRTAKGLTIPQLAERAGLAVGTISNAENGRDVRVTSLRAIAGALDCEIADLMPAETEAVAS